MKQICDGCFKVRLDFNRFDCDYFQSEEIVNSVKATLNNCKRPWGGIQLIMIEYFTEARTPFCVVVSAVRTYCWPPSLKTRLTSFPLIALVVTVDKLCPPWWKGQNIIYSKSKCGKGNADTFLEWLAYIVECFIFICQSLDFVAQRKSDTSRSLHTELTFSFRF